MVENNFAQKKSEYLENVSGHKIVDRQKEINADPNSWTVSSQVFQTGNQVKRKDRLHTGYDAFIYYMTKASEEGKTNSVNEVSKDIIEESIKMDIVIPE